MAVIDVPPHLADVLSMGGVIDRICHIQPLAPGGNNKAWRIDGLDGCCYVVKQYFRHPDDARDRLAAEFGFMQYAYALAPDSVPEPIACDGAHGTALFSFVLGQALRPGDIGSKEVAAAADFFAAINPLDRLERGAALPMASEACFSIADHLSLVGRRVKKLHDVLVDDATVPEARTFSVELMCRWHDMEQAVLDMAKAYGLAPEYCLPQEQRCVSPSDFGFHNALRGSSGDIRFLDFEYAGWDDPAKMVGDFFSQLAVPVPEVLFDSFASAALDRFPDARALLQRACLLRGVYQIKWCCIALNVFLPVHLARRKFADPGLDEHALKLAQLAKATKLFHSLRPPVHYGLH